LAVLPIISGTDLIKVLTKITFKVTRQKGSHVVLRKSGLPPLSIPLHPELKKGLLLSLITVAKVEKDDLIKLLKDP
jgi:predicted RNA binding protein YcfA (HicA-like mRNA interferase family)